MKAIMPLILIVLLVSCNSEKNADNSEINGLASNPTFIKVDSDKSKIKFNNSITADLNSNANLFDFDYFYNGAGVGIADINLDGWQDIFFCSNQNSNKLYLNKGGWEFEDITETAGIAGNNWSTGVTFCDVNSDGLKDIYVCQGGPHKSAERGNLLYVNQGNQTFKEESETYGLNDQGISTQAVFADFDNDGDDDCFVMNEAEVYGFDIQSFFKIINKGKNTLWRNSSHYYENVNGKYIDKTLEAGLLAPSFGLGLVVSDINGDNYLDIYQANDYYIPDALYINNRNGTFQNKIKEHTKQMSFFGMGMDIADINNDGLEDILVLDMASDDHFRSKTLMASMDTDAFNYLVNDLSFPHQYMFNSLQLKNKNNKYDNVSHKTGLAKTDWSWTALIQDFDQDGNAEIFITNGYRKYALDNDFKNLVNKKRKEYNDKVPISEKEKLYAKMPEEKLSNLFYRSVGPLSFENQSLKSGLSDPSYSNGAAYGDLDNDGDLDLVVNNIDATAFVYLNQAKQNNGNYLIVEPIDNQESFAKVTVYTNNKKYFCETKRVRGYMSSSQPIAHFGFKDSVTHADSIKIKWRDGSITTQGKTKLKQILRVKKNETITESEEEAVVASVLKKTSFGKLGLFYNHRENTYNDFSKEILLPFKQSTLGPKIETHNSQQNKTEYLFVPSPYGTKSVIFKSNGKKLNKVATLEDEAVESVDGVFFDLDNDGDQDLYLLCGGNEFPDGSDQYRDRLYINDGADNYLLDKKFVGPTSVGGKVESIDFNNDGYEDLIVANRIKAQSYPVPNSSILYKNNGGKLIDVTKTNFPQLKDFGIINDIVVSDLDGDSWNDVALVGEWTSIGVFENKEGKFQSLADSNLSDSRGLWQSVTETDINADGLPDLLVGNIGLNTKYSASQSKPLRIYAHDFDASGSVDLVLSKKHQNDYVPLRGRECSSDQMPFIKKKFPNYKLFAEATIDEVYENLDEAYANNVTDFSSKILINLGDMKFRSEDLPATAQLSPILDAESVDFNNDGFPDIIVCGNIYNTEPETPRLDYSHANIFLSDGEKYLPSDLNVDLSANVKSIERIKTENQDYLFFGINNGLPQLFEILK